MNLNFILGMGKTKAEGVMDDAVKTLVGLAPENASKTELRQMEQNLDELGRELIKARGEYQGEQREVETATALEHQRMTAAEKLSASLDAESDAEKKGMIERSLTTLLDMIEKNRSNIETHTRAATSAKAFLDELQAAYDGAAKKLLTAKSDLENAARDMKQSELEKKRQLDREQQTRMVAGLASSTSTIGVALSAMQKTAKENRDAVEVSKLKSDALRPSRPETEDPILAAALASASGVGAGPTSAKDRLAALRGAKAA